MASKHERAINAVEPLEPRRLFCATGVTPAAIGAAPLPRATTHVATAQKHATHLRGQLTGSYTLAATVPDIGATYAFTGSGSIAPLNSATGTGTLRLPGYILRGHAAGQLTLENSSGAVTLQLTGPTEPGSGPAPKHLAFTITGGTGAYKSATGHGTITLSLDAAAKTFTLTFRS